MTSITDSQFLILETSDRIGQVAVAHGETICGRRQLDHARRHARDLAVAVHELLKEQGWKPKDITALFAGRGPGSYTGLRVGLMSAKAFAYATGCLLLGIDTFAAIALQACPHSPVEVIADAQQEKLYVQRFGVFETSLPIAETTLSILPVEEWLRQLRPGTCISGPAAGMYQERLKGHFVIDDSQWHPQPDSLLRLGLDRLARGERDDCGTLEPLYLRASQAEEKLAQPI